MVGPQSNSVVTRLDAPAHGLVLGVETTRIPEGSAATASNVQTRNATFESLPGPSTVETAVQDTVVRGLAFWRPAGPDYTERRFVAAAGRLWVDGTPAVMGE